MKILSVLLTLLLQSPAMAGISLPDFKIEISNEQTAKVRAWIFRFTPPPGHHFNLQAPNSLSGQEATFIQTNAHENSIRYRSSDQKLSEHALLTAKLYLCDKAKTYCAAKTQSFKLEVNVAEIPAEKPDEAASPAQTPKPKAKKKDAYGFWDNHLEAAVSESMRTGRPILIDFYGIWCPPCNLLNEKVFSKPAFQKIAQRFVLLKMDADDAESVELKSKLKIGGYPTVIGLKAVSSEDPSRFEEIDRIVGYFPLPEFVQQVSQLYQNRNQALDTKQSTPVQLTSTKLKRIIAVRREQGDKMGALQLSQQAQKDYPNDPSFAVSTLILEEDAHPADGLSAKAKMKMSDFSANPKMLDSPSLLAFIQWVVDQSKNLAPEVLVQLDKSIEVLQDRVDPQSLTVPGTELTLSDVASLSVDQANALADEKRLSAAYLRLVQADERMMKQWSDPDSRALNLELAYGYSKSGQSAKAEKIYTRFQKKFPREFTFYFAAAKHYLEQKSLAQARENAEKAFQFAYGDNQLRAMERLIRVLIAQNETSAAIARGKAFLEIRGGVHATPGVRTEKYLRALDLAVKDAEAGGKH